MNIQIVKLPVQMDLSIFSVQSSESELGFGQFFMAFSVAFNHERPDSSLYAGIGILNVSGASTFSS